MDGTALVGREDVVVHLRQRLRAVGEHGGALVLKGAAGIGKTALLELVRSEARHRGYRVLAATAVEGEARLPFAGLHQLLRPILGRADSLPGPQKDAVLTAFGMREGAAPSLFLVGLAVLTMLTDAATEAPLLLVADDAHWFDPPTAEVLAFVARRLDADPALLLVAVRSGLETPLFAGGLPELELAPLDADAPERRATHWRWSSCRGHSAPRLASGCRPPSCR